MLFRKISFVIGGCALAIFAILFVRLPQPDTRGGFPRLFNGPEVIGHRDGKWKLLNAKRDNDALAKLNKALQPAFSKIDVYRSLLIVCEPGSCESFGFSEELKAFLTHAGDCEMSWRRSMKYETATLISAAVVMRLDFADWNNNVWRNAELRFVYKVDKGPAQLRDMVIVEYVLRDFAWTEFQHIAKKWADLSSSTGYAADLLEAVKAADIANASNLRVRTNQFVSEPQWKMAEWNLKKDQVFDSSQKLAPGYSEDQLIGDPNVEDFNSVTQQLGAGGHVTMPNKLRKEFADVKSNDWGMSMPGMPFPFSELNRKARNLLSLRQCSWCHTKETGTKFNHVGRDPAGGAIVLSDYLTGGRAIPPLTGLKRPTLEGLYYQSADSVNEVKVNYFYGTEKKCEVRNFSELARRKAFLAAVCQATLTGNQPDQASLDAIRSFHLDFTH